MADRGHDAVVALGLEGRHPGAEPFPELRHPLAGAGVGPLRGRDDHGRAAEEVRARHRVAALLGPGHGVAADEPERPLGGEPLGLAHDHGLRAADIGQGRVGRRRPPHVGEHRRDRADGRRQHHEVGAAEPRGEVGRHPIDRAVPPGRLEPPGVPADGDDRPGGTLRPRRLRDGAADEPEPDDRQLLDHADRFPSTAPSARTSRRFSWGVPTVMRSAVSMPKEVIGRTITPSRRSFW